MQEREEAGDVGKEAAPPTLLAAAAKADAAESTAAVALKRRCASASKETASRLRQFVAGFDADATELASPRNGGLRGAWMRGTRCCGVLVSPTPQTQTKKKKSMFGFFKK